MYVRFDGTIINLECISYIKINAEKAEFYSPCGALLQAVPIGNKEEALKIVESAMSYTNLVQAIDRLRDSFDGLSVEVSNCMDRIEAVTEEVGKQRNECSTSLKSMIGQWSVLLGNRDGTKGEQSPKTT